jgi:hypothetical protein
MTDESQQQQIRGINWRETFPFTHLFRAFRIAIHPSKLILGLVALLALYAGGRFLDGVWPARHLAVKDEVRLYEQVVRRGGTSEDFLRERYAARAAIENQYADLLRDRGIVKDRDAALQAARDADKVDVLKDRIIADRNDRVRDAEKTRQAAYSDADKRPAEERRTARADADAAYRTAISAAYDGASGEWAQAKRVKGIGLFHAFFQYEAECVDGVVKGVASWNWLNRGDARPGVIPSVISFFTVGPLWLMRYHPVYFVLFTLLFLTIWGIFGGAIARIAAIHVARDEKLSVRAALAFSIGKFLSFVSAPLIPMLIVLIVGLVPLLAGALQSIPFLGPVFNILIAALFVLVLAAGFVMTLVLLGTFGGFNLMYPTIAVEGSDSFDAISRSFSYVYAKPWRMLFYTIVAIIYGALCYLFVRLFIWLMLIMTHQLRTSSWAPAVGKRRPAPTRYGRRCGEARRSRPGGSATISSSSRCGPIRILPPSSSPSGCTCASACSGRSRSASTSPPTRSSTT